MLFFCFFLSDSVGSRLKSSLFPSNCCSGCIGSDIKSFTHGRAMQTLECTCMNANKVIAYYSMALTNVKTRMRAFTPESQTKLGKYSSLILSAQM